MILSDSTIRARIADGSLGLAPYDPARVQPASYDVTLGSDFIVWRHEFGPDVDTIPAYVDPFNLQGDRWVENVDLDNEGHLLLRPGRFVLATTVERVTLPADLLARLEGKSSLARLGLFIHSAGFIDPGFDGQITLELSNVCPHPIKLYPGMKIGQLCFEQLDRPADRPYGHAELGSKYQGQVGTRASAYDLNAAPAPTTEAVETA